MPLERGAVVSRYVVLDRVGEGGMGVVYAAYDPDLDRKLALKLIRADTRFGSVTVGGERQRLLREAQAMARVSHPAVVGVYDVGAVGDEVFLAMELVDGLTLDRWLAARPRRVGEILDAFLAAGDGLAAAHQAGLVHRDFKPANVLVRGDGRVQVTDFGLAREAVELAAPGEGAPGDARAASETGGARVEPPAAAPRPGSAPVGSSSAASRPVAPTGSPASASPESGSAPVGSSSAASGPVARTGSPASASPESGSIPVEARAAAQVPGAAPTGSAVSVSPELGRAPAEARAVVQAPGAAPTGSPAAALPESESAPAEARAAVQAPGTARTGSPATASPESGSAPAKAPLGPRRPSLSSAVTIAGVVLGTPRYMAPEQRRREAVDARADQYAFCVALREALTGELPADLEPETVPLKPEPKPQPPLAPGRLRGPLRAVLERGLRPEPAQRFESMGALLAALRRARRRNLRAVAVAAVLVAVAAASTSALVLTRAPACEEGQRLAGVWDASRRAELAAAFERARGPEGAAAFAVAARALDEMAGAWTAGAQDACQAARSGRQSAEVASLRARCLEQSLAGLAAVTSVLARVDAQMVDRAQDAIATWGGAGRCSDVPSLLGSEPPALPPDQVAAAARIRARLFESDVLSGVGKNAEAMDLARAQVEEARALGAPSLQAEALHRLAQNQDRGGQTDAALATAREAFPLAISSGYRRISVLLAAAFTYYLGTRQTKFEEALFWGHVGRALVGPRADAEEALSLDANIASIYFIQGRYEESVALYQRIYEHRRTKLGERHQSTLIALGNMSLVLHALGRYEEALAIDERVLAARVELHGPNHRRVAHVIGNLAANQRELGMTTQALESFRRAFQIRRDTMGPEHRDTAISELSLAAALTGAGRAEEALPLIAHAAAALGKAKGGSSGYLAVARCEMGNALGALGRWAEALPHLRGCVADTRALYGEVHPASTLALRELGAALLRTGHRDELLAMIDPMLAAEKTASGERSVAYRRAQVVAAEQLLVAGALDRAEQVLASAEPAIDAAERPDSRTRAHATVVRAELELARARSEAAAAAAQRALALPHLVERAPALAARAQATLGLALLRGPDSSQAASWLGKARNFFEADPKRYDRELQRISAVPAAR